MTIDPAALPPQEVQRYLVSMVTPRPIAWVSTISSAGNLNLAPFSFFNAIGSNPPALIFSPSNNRNGEKKDSLRNVEQTRQFVVNVVPAALAKEMNECSAELPWGHSEFEHAGLTPIPSTRVKPPRVQEAPAAFECELIQIIPVGNGPLSGNIIIGRVIVFHVDDKILDESGKVDPDRLDTVGRMGGALYSYTRQRFAMERPPR
jgi:flavin reductase (DIM6/NTAB) family NADH-FMN oxidoreductase RutF